MTTGNDEDAATTQDMRSGSEHDCDRILYSDAFRRLGGVTQVVAVGETPLFHTRLTHTLKVQQLARRIAEHLNRSPGNVTLLGGLSIDESAAEAAGLAHDLGHPPFGHIAEEVLDELCRKNSLDGFEGNAQTFRVLTKLSRRQHDYGLGITDVTLRAVIKYPWLRTGHHENDGKWNAYPTERAAFLQAREGYTDELQSVEASIMDWADDITYAVHDIEDFVRAGSIPIARVASDDDEFKDFADRAIERLHKKSPDVDWDQVRTNVNSILTTWFAQLGRHRGLEQDLQSLRNACNWLINNYVTAVRFDGLHRPIVVDALLRAEVDLLKQLIWQYVIHNPALATMQEGQKEIVRHLFFRLLGWLEGAIEANEQYRLPTRLRDLYELTGTEPGNEVYPNPEARRARAVADYIASLTEAQAHDLHARLRGVGKHSVLDTWLAY